MTLLERAIVRRITGDFPGATEAVERALGIFRDLGNRDGEAEALNEAGTLHRARGNQAQAEACHRQALVLARRVGSTLPEAEALAGLGRCALAAGHRTEAEAGLRQALEILQRIGAADATGVAAELDALAEENPRPKTTGRLRQHECLPGTTTIEKGDGLILTHRD